MSSGAGSSPGWGCPGLGTDGRCHDPLMPSSGISSDLIPFHFQAKFNTGIKVTGDYVVRLLSLWVASRGQRGGLGGQRGGLGVPQNCCMMESSG